MIPERVAEAKTKKMMLHRIQALFENKNNSVKAMGSLNVVLQPSPYPIVKGTQTNLTISFYQKETSTLQPHIYYDVTISKAGKQLFGAITHAGYIGNVWLHSPDGTITIPYTFPEPGSYSVNVTLFGILFIPVNPESALFKLNVT
jgi:hypothetical protein